MQRVRQRDALRRGGEPPHPGVPSLLDRGRPRDRGRGGPRGARRAGHVPLVQRIGTADRAPRARRAVVAVTPAWQSGVMTGRTNTGRTIDCDDCVMARHGCVRRLRGDVHPAPRAGRRHRRRRGGGARAASTGRRRARSRAPPPAPPGRMNAGVGWAEFAAARARARGCGTPPAVPVRSRARRSSPRSRPTAVPVCTPSARMSPKASCGSSSANAHPSSAISCATDGTRSTRSRVRKSTTSSISRAAPPAATTPTKRRACAPHSVQQLGRRPTVRADDRARAAVDVRPAAVVAARIHALAARRRVSRDRLWRTWRGRRHRRPRPGCRAP